MCLKASQKAAPRQSERVDMASVSQGSCVEGRLYSLEAWRRLQSRSRVWIE
jgi:hypothetical protein